MPVMGNGWHTTEGFQARLIAFLMALAVFAGAVPVAAMPGMIHGTPSSMAVGAFRDVPATASSLDPTGYDSVSKSGASESYIQGISMPYTYDAVQRLQLRHIHAYDILGRAGFRLCT